MIAVCALATPALAEDFSLAPGQQVVGQFHRYAIRQGDVLIDIARRFDVGYTALLAANPGIDPWVPQVGREITIPSVYILPKAPQRGIVINLAEWRLFYFPPGGGQVETHPLGLGVIGKKTPLGVTRVVRKEPNPTWYPPASIRAEEPGLPAFVPPGPDNPLGAFALHLGWKSYLLHGTNKPDGVGQNVSHGCIRLYPEDIQKLFASVAVGTPVRTVNQPVSAGWLGDALYVAVYPSKTQVDEIDTERPVTPDPAPGVRPLVTAAAGPYAGAIDWQAVDEAASERTGMPLRVGNRSSFEAQATQGPPPEPARPADQDAAIPPYYPAPYSAPAQPDSSDPAYIRQGGQAYGEDAERTSDPEIEQRFHRELKELFNRDSAQIDRDAVQPYYPGAEH